VSSRRGGPRRERVGALLALLSASAFGLFAVLLKVAGDEGADSVTVLACRFVIAAPILWLLAARPWRPGPRPRLVPSGRLAAGGLILGLVGYSGQAALFQAAVNRTGAALADLLLYAYPAMVLAAAWVVGRERPTSQRFAALVVASVGVVLVLVGGGESSFDGLGVTLGLGAALAYTLYVMGSDTVVQGLQPLSLAALVATGAAIAYVGAGLLGIGGGLDLGFTATAWWAVIGIAIAGTVVAVTAFLAALELIGPSRASILSTLEPVVTVVLAYLLLGERLEPVQLVGGALVLTACVLLQLRARRAPAYSSPR
jgi:drug/metabolite transporter (DMT)-like permease